MVKRVGESFLKHPTFWFLVGGVAVVVAAYSLGMESATNFISRAYQDKNTSRVSVGLRADSSFILAQTKSIVASGALTPYIAQNDGQHLTDLLNAQKNIHHLTTLVAVNGEGIALARIPALNRNGDYVSQTQPWGRAAARGTSVVSFGIGRTLPLVVVAAVPIVSTTTAGKVQGAVYGGYILDDGYAAKFKDKYLGDSNDVAFYSKQAGIVGASFGDTQTATLVASYFSTGSDLIQHAKEDSNALLYIGGRLYTVSNVPLTDLDQIAVGGVLVFTPYPSVLFLLLFLASILLAFLLSVLLILRFKDRYPWTAWAIPLTVLIIFIFVVGYCHHLWGKRIALISQAPFTIYNSTLALYPDSDIIDLASTQHIVIRLDSGGEAVNAVQATILYDPSKVRIEDILTQNSLCAPNMFLERTIDNAHGSVTISCITPSPGFSETGGVVAELVLEPLQSGTFTLSFGSSTEVLANDGLGTNVLRLTTDGSYNAIAPQPKGGEEPLSIFSPSHSNSARWYNTSRVRITWPTGTEDSIAYAFDQDPAATALNTVASSSGSLEITAPHDGTYYIHMAPQYATRRGPTTSKRINVDTTPPEAPEIKLSQTTIHAGDVVRLNLSSGDAMSGLQKNFYIKFDGGVFLPTGPNVFIPLEELGTNTITVRVFDNAGNFSDASTVVEVER